MIFRGRAQLAVNLSRLRLVVSILGRKRMGTCPPRGSKNVFGLSVQAIGTTAARHLVTRMTPAPQPNDPHRGNNELVLKAILVVDDDQQLATALQWILADENFLVDVAFDGDEALLKVKAHDYDALICDLKMPHVRGDDFYLQARKLRPNLSDSFIFITGYATDPQVRHFLIEQEVKFLVKPFAINGLIQCVRQLL